MPVLNLNVPNDDADRIISKNSFYPLENCNEQSKNYKKTLNDVVNK